MKILLTSTSFQDTPGKHHELLEQQGLEVERVRGPLKEEELLPIIHKYDGVICSDDEYTEAVIKIAAEGKLKVISKYGVGLDQVDLEAAKKYGIKVTNCPGVNQGSVAEHVLALMLSFYRNIHLEYNITKAGKWDRLVGHEIRGKTIAILGLGAVGKEVAKVTKALGLKVKALDENLDKEFVTQNGIMVEESLENLIKDTDILTLHLPLNRSTEDIISYALLNDSEVRDLLIVNTARAKLVEYKAIEKGISEGKLAGYCTDVMDPEPMNPEDIFKDIKNVLITPHIGSRTYQSVQRQGLMSVENLINEL